jgi:hypothetical protein
MSAMCLACEQQEYFFRLWCADFLSRGEMPPGVTEADLEALGLPDPVGRERSQQTQQQRASSSAFSCDGPE